MKGFMQIANWVQPCGCKIELLKLEQICKWRMIIYVSAAEGRQTCIGLLSLESTWLSMKLTPASRSLFCRSWRWLSRSSLESWVAASDAHVRLRSWFCWDNIPIWFRNLLLCSWESRSICCEAPAAKQLLVVLVSVYFKLERASDVADEYNLQFRFCTFQSAKYECIYSKTANCILMTIGLKQLGRRTEKVQWISNSMLLIVKSDSQAGLESSVSLLDCKDWWHYWPWTEPPCEYRERPEGAPLRTCIPIGSWM